MEYDEEKREEQDQFHRRGDYTGPDVAVENVKPWAPMSTEDQLVAMTRVCIKLQEQNKALLEALEAMLRDYEPPDPGIAYGDGEEYPDSIVLAHAAIKAAKE